LGQHGVTAGVVCLTSPDLVFRSYQQHGSRTDGASGTGNIIDELFPAHAPAPLLTVQDGHPHTLSFLAGVRGDRIRCLGVTDFGQSSDLADAYALHGIDVASIVDAALTLAGR
jgi:pyruvate dehydrogenase E1 component